MKDDPFSTLARYYDVIMEHVDYSRWGQIAEHLTDACPRELRYLDVGCGTGVMLEFLQDVDRHCFGLDLSPAMVMQSKKNCPQAYISLGSMTKLPFKPTFHLITCLFDSLNFVLEEDAVVNSLQGFADSLLPGGLVYFDVVTERMVTEHFLGPEWSEQHGRFTSSWHTTYDRESHIATTRVTINGRDSNEMQERIYPIEWLMEEVRNTGLEVLACYDANTWKKPGRRTIRVEFIAALEPDRKTRRMVDDLLKQMRNT